MYSNSIELFDGLCQIRIVQTMLFKPSLIVSRNTQAFPETLIDHLKCCHMLQIFSCCDCVSIWVTPCEVPMGHLPEAVAHPLPFVRNLFY